VLSFKNTFSGIQALLRALPRQFVTLRVGITDEKDMYVKYAVEIGSIPAFIQIGPDIQKFLKEIHTETQTAS
jgi:hypothetical protein